MENLIEIRFTTDESSEKDKLEHIDNVCQEIENRFKKLVQETQKEGFWDNSISKIVITDQYHNDIESQAKEWNQQVRFVKEKEYSGISKILFNYNSEHPSCIIFFSLEIILQEQFENMVKGQFIAVYSFRIIPNSLKKFHSAAISLVTLDDYVNYSLISWMAHNYSSRIEKLIFKDYKSGLNANLIFHGFCRKLKKNLFEYNSDDGDNDFRIGRFWNNTYADLNNRILRFITIKTIDEALFVKNEVYLNIISSIVDDVNALTDIALNGDIIDINKLKKSVIAFFKHFDIELSESKINNSFGIHFSKNPKDYFKNEIVDIEPRFVCYLDILGFQEMIDNYENDDTSTILQDIQEAFDESIKLIKPKDKSDKQYEVTKNLQYRLFSDCVSVSIPYFDNEADFLSNFNLISTFVNGFQYVMMLKGFFIRGGLSMGSYYSNENIIFSKGLVNAYHLEKDKAIYPRVLIDDEIVKKLNKYDLNKIISFGIDKYLIVDWEGLIFLNPFISLKSAIERFDILNHQIGLDYEDETGKQLGQLIDTTFNSIKNLMLTVIQPHEAEVNKLIKAKIETFKQQFMDRKDQKNLSKYIWLEEFMYWIENNENAKLKFRYCFNNNPQPKINYNKVND